MSTNDEIARLTQAVQEHTQVTEGFLGQADARVSTSEKQFQNWMDTRHVGFSLVDSLLDHRDTYISIPPKFSTIEEAEAFSFNSSDDYSPEGNFADLANRVPAQANWFSEPTSTQFTGKISVYANISVGTNPHPTPKPVNRIALLHNQIGAHHSWITTPNATPNYNEPRIFMGKSQNMNLEIKGQSYGVTNYDDLISLAENEPHNISIGFSHVRLINLGPYPIQVKGFWIIHHGYQKEA